MVGTAESSYILNFFADLKQLTDSFSAYLNAISAIHGKASNSATKEVTKDSVEAAIQEKTLTDEEVQSTVQWATHIRYWVIQLYVKFMGLKDKINEIKTEEKKLTDLYRTIQTQQYPDALLVETFVITAHRLFSTSALNDMLIKDQQFFEQASGFNEPIEERKGK